jgi:hypothetical protein
MYPFFHFSPLLGLTSGGIFASANGTGQIRMVGGVQEIPAQNTASAQIDLNGFKDKNGTTWSLGGKAVFTHYTDGKWVLKEVWYNGSVLGGPRIIDVNIPVE